MLRCRRTVWGADPAKENEEAARGRDRAAVGGGDAHPAAGGAHASSRTAGDDWEAGGHAEAMQQEVLHWPTQSHSECLPNMMFTAQTKTWWKYIFLNFLI